MHCVCETQSELIIHTRQKRIAQFPRRVCITVNCAGLVNDRTSFLLFFFLFFFRGGLVRRCTGNSLERAQAEIESKASKLFLSPQQGFCCCTAEIPQLRAAPWLAEGEITALCMLSEAVSSPPCSAGGFHTHKMDQLSSHRHPSTPLSHN